MINETMPPVEQNVTMQPHSLTTPAMNSDVHHHHQLHHQQQHSVILQDAQNMPKQVTNLTTLSTVSTSVQPHTIPSAIVDRKYDLSSPSYYSTATTATTPFSKKKRKMNECSPSSVLFRSPSSVGLTMGDRRPMYENDSNDHTLLSDNYSNFDCNVSWQTSSLPAINASVGKWWS